MSPLLSPASLLGLPFGLAEPFSSVPALRYLLLALAGLWALLASRGRRLPTFAAGVLFVWTVLGFWTLSFARPYGLFEPGPATREAAYAAQLAAAQAPRGFVAGEPFAAGPWGHLALHGAPFGTLVAWPSLLPFLTLPLPALVVLGLWRRPQAQLAAAALLAFSTTELEALRGTGIVTGAWGHPAAALGLPLLLAALLRGPTSGWLSRPPALLAGLVGLALCWEPHPAALPLAGLPHALLLDPWPWPLLALFGLRAERDPGVWACLLAGAVCLGASALGLQIDAWSGFALWRFGLVLAAAGPLANLLERAAQLVAQRQPRLQGRPGLGLALLLLAGLPCAFLTWWSPLRLDPLAHASLQPVPPAVTATTGWMRQNLPPSAVVVASADYAPMVAVLAQRQVLRAPQLVQTADDYRRERLESSLFTPGPLGARNALRYGVSHVLLGPGDARRWGFGGELDPPVPGRFRLLFAHPKGFRVYALGRWDGQESAVAGGVNRQPDTMAP